MSVTGLALILFLTFHACMNVVAIFSAEAYNQICKLLGSNWYALVATAGLAALMAIHIVFALILTHQNAKARGNNKYAITSKPEKVEWASQNMFALGIIICLGLILHLHHFWENMMLAELIGAHKAIAPTDGFEWIAFTFGSGTTASYIYTVLYLIWIVAIWFHLAHGMWSSMQTLGVSGHIWFNRWKCIGQIWATLIMGAFALVVILFCLCPDSLGKLDGNVLPFIM
jgi:succinate dehydrogenase / fumarate reductase cytochrome b subunit